MHGGVVGDPSEPRLMSLSVGFADHWYRFNKCNPRGSLTHPEHPKLCYGLEKLGQKVLSHCYFCVFLKNSSP